MTETGLRAPAFDDVLAAAERLRGAARATPVMTSRTADAAAGASFFFKAENLQRGGAFKFRGAYNAIARLGEAARATGVVAYSSGNHAQAVALAGAALGVRATIVMPSDAPPAKVAATRGYGAGIVFYDRYTQDRQAIALEIAQATGAPTVPPFDHPDVIAGQGTAALELLDEVGPLDRLFVPCGGGGLLAGSALAARARAPGCRVVGVEPEAGDDVRRSLAAGAPVTIPTPRTIADGAQTTRVGDWTFPIIRTLVHEVVTASDDALRERMRFFLERMKLVVEPTGCLGAAAALARAEPGARIGVILSGGNVDVRPGGPAGMLAGIEVR